jgi:hypothetical protein
MSGRQTPSLFAPSAPGGLRRLRLHNTGDCGKRWNGYTDGFEPGCIMAGEVEVEVEPAFLFLF